MTGTPQKRSTQYGRWGCSRDSGSHCTGVGAGQGARTPDADGVPPCSPQWAGAAGTGVGAGRGCLRTSAPTRCRRARPPPLSASLEREVPPSPQRHECPQGAGLAAAARPRARGWRGLWPSPATGVGAAAHGGEGTGWGGRPTAGRGRGGVGARGGEGTGGVGARSGRRVRALHLPRRTLAPDRGRPPPPRPRTTHRPWALRPHRTAPLRRRRQTSPPTDRNRAAGTPPQPNTRPSVYTTGPAAASGRATPAVKWTKRDG
ncbi:hypothetical protein GA0115245_100534 [Streptomyces sp. di188]|nr:hypothetical protein GA0115245_100534 [Streptomyces sp. di188]